MKKDNSKEYHKEEEIKMKTQNIKDSTEVGLEIKELTLQKDKSKSDSINMEISNENNIPNMNVNLFILDNSLHINNLSNSLSNINQNISDSTNFKSNLSLDSNNSIINESLYLYKFNSLRANYYLQYKLYDIPLADEIINFNKNYYPPKYKINDELFSFVYPNDITTYSISIIGFLANNKIINYDLNKNLEVNDSQYYSLLGLFFCGNNEEIIIDNKLYIKRCLPNVFICKKCMLINKRKYNLKNSFLININGRVTKKNKVSHHCFGHFLSGNQIEDCISKFTCKACKMINYYLEYYTN